MIITTYKITPQETTIQATNIEQNNHVTKILNTRTKSNKIDLMSLKYQFFKRRKDK